jgi:general secretion pathway protein M
MDRQEQPMNEALMQFWSERSPRERLLLGLGGALLAVLLLYSILWAPAQAGRDELGGRLPAMRAELARMRQQADEARVLAPAAVGVAATGDALRDAVAGSLGQAGMPGAQVNVAGNAVRVQLKNVPFGAWTAWLDDARRQLKVQVAQAHITAGAPDGQVDIEATLQPPVPASR